MGTPVYFFKVCMREKLREIGSRAICKNEYNAYYYFYLPLIFMFTFAGVCFYENLPNS